MRWRFAESLGHERIEALEGVRSFKEIAQAVAASPLIKCTHIDPCDEASGFSRPIGCIVIDRPLFDLYFNSPYGYRAAYYASPEYGLEMNAFLLKLLAPALTGFRHHKEMSSDLMFKSLVASSAKSWLAEGGKGYCSQCEGDWTLPTDGVAEILNERWEIATDPNSRYGRRAPFLKRIRVMGAFVNPAGEEYVATRK